jgi:hypothetical protein
MKRVFTTSAPATSSRLANGLAAIVLAGVPFHGFLTVWGSSLIGGYTALRLWDDVLLLVLLAVCGWWLARDADLRRWFAGSLLVRLIAAYTALSVLLGCVSLVKGDVTARALAFGLLLNLRFLAWFLAVLLAARQSPWLGRHWRPLLLAPAAVVVLFATLQYTVLPHDFLRHFGYNAATNIAPIETINHNPRYIRVQSTLRGANPLGAYLVVVLAGLGVLLVRGRGDRVLRGRRLVLGVVFAVAGLLALYASGSRSAWIGVMASLLVIGWLRLRPGRARLVLVAVCVTTAVAALGGFMLVRHNTAVQNHLLHTQQHSAIATNSNEGHISALTTSMHDVVRQPFGDGPGTAGPASQHNTGHRERIAENYYVQVAQETGWLGLALLVCIFVLVAWELYLRLPGSCLALVLFASLAGLAVVNLLGHAWTDDSVAFVWWGLAGIALAVPTRVKSGPKHARTDA